MSIPVLDRDAVRELDRRAIQEYGIPGIVLMENAGRGCADVLCQLGSPGPVAICCGRGNNAGDGLVLARHLELRGVMAELIFWSDPDQLRGDAGTNREIAAKARLAIHVCAGPQAMEQLERRLEGVAWIVDALLGTGAQGEPRFPLNGVIDRLNAHPARKLAIDIPSGLDCQTGQPARHTFRADHTCTFVAAKPDLVPVSKPMGRPAGEWNQLEICCRGARISVKLNGQDVASMNCDEFDRPGVCPDGEKHKYQLHGEPRAIKDFARTGYIGLQDHGHKVWYRNIKLLELK